MIIKNIFKRVLKSLLILFKPDKLLTYLSPKYDYHNMSFGQEGYDLDVLKSNNWEKYKPRFIMIEDLQRNSVKNVLDNKITYYLQGEEYDFMLKTINTLFYIHKDSKFEF